jgi:hypothetical protein
MFRKAVEIDQKTINEYTGKEPSINLFIIADIENNGISTDFQDIWVDERNGTLTAVLLRYFGNYVFYSTGNHDQQFVNEMINSQPMASFIGRKKSLEPYIKHERFQNIRSQILAVATDKSFCGDFTAEYSQVRFACPGDAKGLYKLWKEVEEFAPYIETPESIKKKIERKRVKTVLIEIGREVISTASTITECKTSAMIGGVMTKPGYRTRGYATACMTALCETLISEGKECCLTYDNPLAGSIYSHVGFKPVCDWVHCAM